MKTIKVGIAGLGRLGKVHANNIAFKIPNAQLTAACSIMPAELEYAKTELGVTDVYTDFREMLEKADIDAVAIVTTSSEHCWQIEAALDDANVKRYARYLNHLTEDTQFIIITHRRGTMNAADALYGVTMQEKGVSALVSVNLIENDLIK